MWSSWSSVIATRGSSPDCHRGTGAGAWTSSRPSRTSSPTSAWVMLFAIDHEINVVAASVPGA